ncbi:nutrient deprivation-induced protein [Rhizobium deserti]|uniref:nutrient deprivation-induced protein n=1 Tax=Rhizobium deserti TaxID=2547961 RepID=UPI00192A5947|nr:nutrient deprivation-induced protein [Rhizobium deserti]
MTERDMGQSSTGTTSSSYPSFKEQTSPQAAPQTPSSGSTGDSQNKQASAQKPATIDIRNKVSEDLRTVQQTAKDGMSQATDKALDMAGSQKNFLAEQMSGIAAAMEKVGGELQQGDQAQIGNLAKTLGSSVRKFSEDIKGRDIGDIAGMAEDFGRKQPFAFLGVAAIAGLAASRFLTASSHRYHGKSADTATSQGANRTASTGASTSTQPTASASPRTATFGDAQASSSFTSTSQSATEGPVNG